jgi:hypothetical protein
VVVDVEATDGRRVRGYAGDNLAPKWFDKERIESGFVRVGSLSLPGYRGPSEPDLSSMTPLERWTFDSLESKS